MKDSLEKLMDSEIILNLIFLKSGNKNFLFETLKKGLSDVEKESSALKMGWDDISRIIFIYNEWVAGDLYSEYYKLSSDGRKYVQSKFDTYTPELQQRLKYIAEKVWQ